MPTSSAPLPRPLRKSGYGDYLMNLPDQLMLEA